MSDKYHALRSALIAAIQVGRELAAVPMTPRQEAIFLIMGYID